MRCLLCDSEVGRGDSRYPRCDGILPVAPKEECRSKGLLLAGPVVLLFDLCLAVGAAIALLPRSLLTMGRAPTVRPTGAVLPSYYSLHARSDPTCFLAALGECPPGDTLPLALGVAGERARGRQSPGI